MDSQHKAPGRLIKAPENFLDRDGVGRVFAEGKQGRRDFIRSAFVAAGAAVAAPMAVASSNPVGPLGGDPNILELPEISVILPSTILKPTGEFIHALAITTKIPDKIPLAHTTNPANQCKRGERRFQP